MIRASAITSKIAVITYIGRIRKNGQKTKFSSQTTHTYLKEIIAVGLLVGGGSSWDTGGTLAFNNPLFSAIAYNSTNLITN